MAFLELDEAEEKEVKPEREPKLFRKRWDKDYYIALAEAEGSFQKEYRVTYDEFNALVSLLKPFPYHWIGDNAYALTETMMIPFAGSNLHLENPPEEWFNFWQSQLRITIERTFGIFIRRWGIFWKPLSYSLKHNMAIIHACCRLHNLCNKRNCPTSSPVKYLGCLPIFTNEGTLADVSRWYIDKAETNWDAVSSLTKSTLRDNIVDVIERNHLMHSRSHHR